MNYDEAIRLLKDGKLVARGGRTFGLSSRGVHDVTDPENPEHVYMSDDDRTATDWEAQEMGNPQ